MNTTTDLHAELCVLATRAPSDAAVREALANRIQARARRCRITSLTAAAAAVVLLVGGAGIAGSLLLHHSAGPAVPTPVVTVPAVPLPANTKLIRHQLQEVITPVTAVPPDGLSGNRWMSAPGRLSVSFFDGGAAGGSIIGSDSSAAGSRDKGGSSPAAAGYTITDQRDERVQSLGPDGLLTVKVAHQNVTVGGHSAILDTAPADATDDFGFPAGERISWQLPAGSWIHVWASGFADKGALRNFAAGITDEPQALDRTVGVGLTLPGLTVDSSVSSWPTVAQFGASVYLCPRGVDPMTMSYSSSTGSGSSSPSTGSSSAGAGAATTTGQGPASRCVTAGVMNIPVRQLQGLSTTETITVGDTIAHIDTRTQSSWTDLGGDTIALVAAPRDAQLSAADLAALVASVRLSPAATLIPMQIEQGSAQLGVATVMSSASAIPAPDRTQSGQDPQAGAVQRTVVTGYLDAVEARDCTAADRYFAQGKPQSGSGDLCQAGSLRLLGYRIDSAPATPSPDEVVFAVTITTTGGDESMHDLTTWFLDLQRQPSGNWLLTGGGSGP